MASLGWSRSGGVGVLRGGRGEDADRETWTPCVRTPRPHPGREAPGAPPAGTLALRTGRGGFRLLSLCPDGDACLWSRSEPARTACGAANLHPPVPGARGGPSAAPTSLPLLCLSAGGPQPTRSSEQQHHLSACSPVSPAPRGSPELAGTRGYFTMKEGTSEGRSHAARSHNFPKGTVCLCQRHGS